MANATVSESCSFDDLNDIEFSDIDSSLVMSLLEDSQMEGDDDERLRSVIQSLEAEITNQNSFLDSELLEGYLEDYYQFSDVEQIESCSTLPDCVCFEEFDDDMIMPYVINDFADEIENVVEFVGIGDYNSEICYGMAMEESDYHGLWQI